MYARGGGFGGKFPFFVLIHMHRVSESDKMELRTSQRGYYYFLFHVTLSPL